MKKAAAAMLLVLLLLTGCGDAGHIRDTDKPAIACIGFAQYDWVLNILGEKTDEWNVIRINDDGADMHSYQPVARDIVDITTCDLLIYTGGESEKWVEDIIEGGFFEGHAYCLLEHGQVAMIEEETDNHDEEAHHGHSHTAHEEEGDEHIWLSLNQAQNFCGDITECISEIDNDNSRIYMENAEEYIEKLEMLDNEFRNTVSESSKNTVIVADRFAFRYLFNDYGIKSFAAFDGCSAKTEASFETVAFLADKLKEEKLGAIVVTETGDRRIAETVISTSGEKDIRIIDLDSMQSVKAHSCSYIDIMEYNLQQLRQVLN